MKEVEIEAKTAQEAIGIALERLGAKKNEVEVRILDEENKGLFGMKGSKGAKVKVTMKRRK